MEAQLGIIARDELSLDRHQYREARSPIALLGIRRRGAGQFQVKVAVTSLDALQIGIKFTERSR